MRPTWLLLTSTLLFSSLHHSYTSTNAQIPFTPKPRYHAESVFIERQKLFIHGGIEQDIALLSSQTFYIDLSRPWTTSSPIYGKLANGPAAMGSTTALSDYGLWYSFYDRWVRRYNIQGDFWEEIGEYSKLVPTHDHPAFFDPVTDMFYIPNSNELNGKVYGTFGYDTFDSPEPTGGLFATVPPEGSFTATWSTLKNTAFIFGGYTTTNNVKIPQKSLYFFDHSSVGNITASASDNGDGPTARYDHCMVAAYEGTKMILFGGIGLGDQYLDDIYILDVASLKWTKGTPGGPTVARRHASCAVTNDLFVVWGGAIRDSQTTNMRAVSENVTIVYNLKTNQWQDTYSPDPYVPPPPLSPAVIIPPNSGTGTGSGSDPTGAGASGDSGATSGSNSSIRWIIGGAVGGGLAVVGNVVALFIFCRGRRQVNKDSPYSNVVKDSPHVASYALPTKCCGQCRTSAIP
ncbi:MAG: hypothetical protein J3R72DRAFT_477966 [Linnemannia gamsii]|nr:MAG: hypothetical protein J3R72DRAFT_477963 [Linnemannia gamsii]KAK3833694.1 MAG: hypothetical protein J3R72DRAFT_477966 [Linnemannia gamsii]